MMPFDKRTMVIGRIKLIIVSLQPIRDQNKASSIGQEFLKPHNPPPIEREKNGAGAEAAGFGKEEGKGRGRGKGKTNLVQLIIVPLIYNSHCDGEFMHC